MEHVGWWIDAPAPRPNSLDINVPIGNYIMIPDANIIKDCSSTWGTVLISDDKPAIEHHKYLTFLPFSVGYWYDTDPFWGLYNSDQKLVDAAAYYRVSADRRELMGQSLEYPGPITVNNFESGTFIYIGSFVGHYGHFMLDCLSRLWPFADREHVLPPNVRLVLHAYGDEADVLLRDYIREIFNALNIDHARLFVPRRPTLLENVIVPRTSFEINHYGHTAFKTLCQNIGSQLDAGNFEEKAYYFSRSKLKAGNFNVVNENVIESSLERHGVEIVHPQELSFRDQLTIARRATTVYGITGSALHNVIFAGKPQKIRCLNLGPGLNSNYSIVDRLYGNDARYFFCDGVELQETNTQGFVHSFCIKDPERVVEQLITIA